MSKEAVAQVLEIQGLKKLVDEIAANTPLYYTDLQEILNETDFWKRYEALAFKLVNEVQIMDIKEEIQLKVKERVDKHQREFGSLRRLSPVPSARTAGMIPMSQTAFSFMPVSKDVKAADFYWTAARASAGLQKKVWNKRSGRRPSIGCPAK